MKKHIIDRYVGRFFGMILLEPTESATGRPAAVQPVKTDACDGVKVTQRLNGRLVTATVLFNREGPVGGSIAATENRPAPSPPPSSRRRGWRR